VASLSQGRTAAAQCGLFTYKSVPVIFEPPCIFVKILKKSYKVAELLRSAACLHTNQSRSYLNHLVLPIYSSSMCIIFPAHLIPPFVTAIT